MKPNFALGLTKDGITLWHGDGAGWLRVGAVPMDAPDLDDQMQALAAEARALTTEAMTTKLVIPDEQILYTSLPADTAPDAIRDALQGRTPYPVEELDFDWIAEDGALRVAVVARETLIQAEDFAKAQGLNPVCFVAAPANDGFACEPFFKVARGVFEEPEALGRGGPILQETGHVAKAAPQDPPETSPQPAAPEPVADAADMAAADAVAAGGETSETASKVLTDAPKADAPPVADDTKDTPQPEQTKPDAKATEPARTDIVPDAGAGSSDTQKPSAGASQAAPTPLAGPTDDADAIAEPVSFRSRRSASTPVEAAPKPVTPMTPAKRRALSLGSLGQDRLREKLRAAKGLLARASTLSTDNSDSPAKAALRRAAATAQRKPAEGAPQAAQPVAPSRSARNRSTPDPTTQVPTTGPKAKAPPRPQQSKLQDRKLATPLRKPESDPEAERLTVFGARRHSQEPSSPLPKRALLISGAALLLVLAVSVWAFYFTRSGSLDLAQPELGVETTADIAAPEALALPDADPTAETAADDESETATDDAALEAALGLPDAAQQQAADAARQPESTAPDVVTSTAPGPENVVAGQDTGRLAALRSVRALAPVAPNGLPNVQGPPAPFGATPLPPLREQPQADATPPEIEATAEATGLPTGLPPGEEALTIAVTQGQPASVPPARPAGLAPEPPEPAVVPEPEPLPEPAVQAPQAVQAPLSEGDLVIEVTDGTPPITPPDRPAGLASTPPAEAPETAPAAVPADPQTTDGTEADQASLAPPPGGVVLTLFSPAPRPPQIVEQAVARTEQFASATAQAVAVSMRPSNRPAGFSQNVQRAIAAARQRQQAAPEPQIVQASAASAAPRIPSSASVSRAATQTRAINLRQINLLGVMGTPSARRALVRLDNGRVVTVSVGERLDGGQVTAIGESELRYNKRGRDVVLRLAS